MVKTSSRKSRGIRGNVRRRVLRLGQNDGKPDGTHHCSVFSKGLKKVGPLAKAQWNFLLHLCSKWNLIPMEYDPVTGRVGLSVLWKRCIHNLLVTLYIIIAIYRLYVTFQRVTAGNLDLFTYMCGCSIMVSFVSAAVLVGSTCSSSRLCDLIKSWKSMEHISKIHICRPRTPFEDKAISIKLLLCAAGFNLAGIYASMLSFLGEVPTYVLPTLTRIGWLELPDYVPRVLWASIFFPLELLTLWPPMMATGVNYNAFILGLGTFKVFADQVRYVILFNVYINALTWINKTKAASRKENVRNMNHWMTVFRLRRIMQVYNFILLDWGKNVAVMGFTSPPCAVILLLYVTIRPSNLPFIIYIGFPIVSALVMIIVSWVAYDCVIIKRTVADVEGNLHSGLDSWRFRDMTTRRRTAYNRMLLSFRPASLKLGPFGDITLDVPINAWDEVLNQLLFLLSL